MGINFWIQLVVQIAIVIFSIGYMLKIERDRPTESINPQNAEDLQEL